ncbi:MAG TPA: hypothetical protein VF759_13015 [Allosphingosinicella sp.]|jgi:hypothetical protein
MRHKRALLAAGAAIVAAVGGGVLLLRPAPASGLENGRFEADCCGTIELRDGEMLLNGRQTVRYDVGRDSQGPYLLPRTYYVGGLDARGFEVDGTRPNYGDSALISDPQVAQLYSPTEAHSMRRKLASP